MIRKYHNHKLQTTLWHREEEPLNHHETPGRQIKQSNQLSLPHQDDCNTRRDIKQRTTIHSTITDSHNGSNNKQLEDLKDLRRSPDLLNNVKIGQGQLQHIMEQILFSHLWGLQTFWSSDLNNLMNNPSNSPVISEKQIFR